MAPNACIALLLFRISQYRASSSVFFAHHAPGWHLWGIGGQKVGVGISKRVCIGRCGHSLLLPGAVWPNRDNVWYMGQKAGAQHCSVPQQLCTLATFRYTITTPNQLPQTPNTPTPGQNSRIFCPSQARNDTHSPRSSLQFKQQQEQQGTAASSRL